MIVCLDISVSDPFLTTISQECSVGYVIYMLWWYSASCWWAHLGHFHSFQSKSFTETSVHRLTKRLLLRFSGPWSTTTAFLVEGCVWERFFLTSILPYTLCPILSYSKGKSPRKQMVLTTWSLTSAPEFCISLQSLEFVQQYNGILSIFCCFRSALLIWTVWGEFPW